jgi:hypothetical protein
MARTLLKEGNDFVSQASSNRQQGLPNVGLELRLSIVLRRGLNEQQKGFYTY